MKKIALQAAAAVGGGFLGVDLFETEDGYMVNEVNHTPEFKNVQRVTGVNVAREVISYCMEVAAE
jgi:[lysine-biosynthesis-protein LysW]--L-2-aminoadipate ligase